MARAPSYRRAVTWPEAAAYAELAADFHRRHGRDATPEETDELVDQAREIVASDVASSKMVH